MSTGSVSDLPCNVRESGAVHTQDGDANNQEFDPMPDCPHPRFHQSCDEDVLMQQQLVVPKICITEGESDSDDTEEHSQVTDAHACECSYVQHYIDNAMHGSVIERAPEAGPFEQYRRPFMVYKGHRNARTMVS